MKRVVRSLLCLLSFVLAALAPLGSAHASSGVLRFGVAAEPYPPFLMKSPTGQWSGFEADLIRALCEQMKAKCEIKEVAWDGIIPALLSDKIDVIFNSMSITPERQKVIAFSRPYYETPGTFVGAKNQKLTLTPDGLKGKVIGVQGSTANAEFIKMAYGKNATVRLYNTQDDCNSDLVAGRIDTMYLDQLGILDFLKSKDGSAFELKGPGSVKMDPAIFGYGVGAGMRKADAPLKLQMDQALEQLHASGKYAQIAKKYFPIDLWPH
ncbi:transporter substrate-binding domain-containing protein [Burkholderia sp. JKS000303]|uniref:transporter substrate-binding domain-containing protein n=1 Tax=Burkholderia sp. JKS000303 TaxID=1938747 RepID=UPI000BF9C995|nr:transporter substrate-binding domain-containing protein [Burkholderia sp. JKS000303]PFH30232.1 amino acid ABC transporter substrate-binding protein (PAAT family) [Burkholderia sp. JKS000303]